MNASDARRSQINLIWSGSFEEVLHCRLTGEIKFLSGFGEYLVGSYTTSTKRSDNRRAHHASVTCNVDLPVHACIHPRELRSLLHPVAVLTGSRVDLNLVSNVHKCGDRDLKVGWGQCGRAS